MQFDERSGVSRDENAVAEDGEGEGEGEGEGSRSFGLETSVSGKQSFSYIYNPSLRYLSVSPPQETTTDPPQTIKDENDLGEQNSQQVAQKSRWQAMLLEAGGISAALSEESMRRLKYCLQWLQVNLPLSPYPLVTHDPFHSMPQPTSTLKF